MVGSDFDIDECPGEGVAVDLVEPRCVYVESDSGEASGDDGGR